MRRSTFAAAPTGQADLWELVQRSRHSDRGLVEEVQEVVVLRARLQDAPWWVWSLAAGAWFAVGMSVTELLQGDEGPLEVVITGTVSGGLLGGVLGPWWRAAARREGEVLGAVEPAMRAVARRAAWRGPVPEDPRVRRAAARLLALRLEERQRQRRWILPAVLVLLAGAGVLLAMEGVSRAGLSAAVVALILAGLGVALWAPPRRMQRRLARLQDQDVSLGHRRPVPEAEAPGVSSSPTRMPGLGRKPGPRQRRSAPQRGERSR